MTAEERLAAVQALIRNRGLPLRITRKRSSVLMWLVYAVSLMWIWNRRFMPDYVTTVAGRIYIPDGMSANALWRVLAHEGVHLEQARRDGELRFSLAYLFPVPLALLALLALGALACSWALLFLTALVALAPLPAPWRVRYEREAYLVSAVCDALSGVDIAGEDYLAYQVEHHCGWGYYRPAWNRARIAEQVHADLVVAKRIAEGEPGTTYAHEIARVVMDR